MHPTASALHPRLLQSDGAAVLASWSGPALVVPNAVVPGFLHALHATVCRLDIHPRQFNAQGDQSWSLDVQMPLGLDPQLQGALYVARRFAQDELAAWLTEAGIPVGPCPDPLHLWAWRKGAYVERGVCLAAQGGVDAWLALDDLDWPESWGGVLTVLGQPIRLRRGDLLLLRGAQFELSLLRHHVEAKLLRTWFPPEVAP